MESTLATTIISLGAICILGLVAFLGPHGLPRLLEWSFWSIVVFAALPPFLFGFRKSEDPALWLVLCTFVALGSAAVAFLIGVFLPTTWSWWVNALIGVSPWVVVGLSFVLVAFVRWIM